MDLLSGADVIVIEANHDEEMLRYGRYPIFLKKRILSDHGHLSNDACGEAVARLAERGTRHFFLAHLSQENNRPELALDNAVKATAGMNVSISVLPVYGGRIMEID
jgi:phosphoribosyl 1,2-cyclic phosphodiesterase